MAPSEQDPAVKTMPNLPEIIPEIFKTDPSGHGNLFFQEIEKSKTSSFNFFLLCDVEALYRSVKRRLKFKSHRVFKCCWAPRAVP